MCLSSNEYSEKNFKLDISNYISCEDTLIIKAPKVIAKIKICGGGLTFTITDDMQFEMPTEEQCENLKKLFGIEVEAVEEG